MILHNQSKGMQRRSIRYSLAQNERHVLLSSPLSASCSVPATAAAAHPSSDLDQSGGSCWHSCTFYPGYQFLFPIDPHTVSFKCVCVFFTKLSGSGTRAIDFCFPLVPGNRANGARNEWKQSVRRGVTQSAPVNKLRRWMRVWERRV